MSEDLKLIATIDIFVMMMAGDRLGNQALHETMKYYQDLLGGGRIAWNNICLVIPKMDYNPNTFDDFEEWEEVLTEKEGEAIAIVEKNFGAKPLGCVAVS